MSESESTHVHFTVRVRREDRTKLGVIAARSGRTVADVVRSFLDAGIDANPVSKKEMATLPRDLVVPGVAKSSTKREREPIKRGRPRKKKGAA